LGVYRYIHETALDATVYGRLDLRPLLAEFYELLVCEVDQCGKTGEAAFYRGWEGIFEVIPAVLDLGPRVAQDRSDLNLGANAGKLLVGSFTESFRLQ